LKAVQFHGFRPAESSSAKQGAYNSGKPGNPREFVNCGNSGKTQEF